MSEPIGQFATVQVQGQALQLHYHDLGSGPVVVMLHGAGPGASGWSNFQKNMGVLAQAGLRVIVPDAPGWNLSAPVRIEQGFRSDFNAAAVQALLAHLGIDQACVVGNSMGAMTALAMALNYPQLVHKLVLMGSGGLGTSLFSPAPMEGIKAMMALYRQLSYENFKKMMQVFVYDAQQLSEELQHSRYQNILTHPEHLENFKHSQQVNPAQFPDFSPRLKDITQPTLVIWGKDDRFMPLDYGLKLLAGIKKSDLHIFGQCGHWAQWEHADKFNHLCVSFMQGDGVVTAASALQAAAV